jgi:hypothetical protein
MLLQRCGITLRSHTGLGNINACRRTSCTVTTPLLYTTLPDTALPPGSVRSLMNTPSCTALFCTSHGE